MNIWFGTTTAKWPQYRNYYLKIRSYLKELECNLLFDWMDKADEAYENNTPRNITKIYNEVIDAIDKSDIVIIEYTVPNFSSSHQINYALLKKKPVLVLRLKKDNPYYTGSYLEALQSPLLTVKDYTLSNYKDILKEYLSDSFLSGNQQRYNIVLGKKQKQYLDWASAIYRLSRSQIIKDLIDTKLRNDPFYSNSEKTT